MIRTLESPRYHWFIDNKVSDASMSQIVNLESSFLDVGHSASVGVIYVRPANSFQEPGQDNVAIVSDRQILTGLLHLN